MIGFIGLGTMGTGMVAQLKQQHDVRAYNRTPKQDSVPLDDIPAADIIFMCVANDKAIENILFTQQFLSKLAGKTFVDCSTTSLEMTEKIATTCAKHDVTFLDAPITGSKLAAESGNLTFMVGGPKAAYDQLLPFLKLMGKTHVYCGPATYGQRAKIALNLTQALVLESYLEGLMLGLKNGVPLEALEEIMEHSGAKNAVGTFKLPYIKRRDFAPHFKASLMHKDVLLAENERKKLGLQLPLAEQIVGVFEEAAERGDEDVATIVKTLEKKAEKKIK